MEEERGNSERVARGGGLKGVSAQRVNRGESGWFQKVLPRITRRCIDVTARLAAVVLDDEAVNKNGHGILHIRTASLGRIKVRILKPIYSNGTTALRDQTTIHRPPKTNTALKNQAA